MGFETVILYIVVLAIIVTIILFIALYSYSDNLNTLLDFQLTSSPHNHTIRRGFKNEKVAIKSATDVSINNKGSSYTFDIDSQESSKVVLITTQANDLVFADNELQKDILTKSDTHYTYTVFLEKAKVEILVVSKTPGFRPPYCRIIS